MTSPPVTDRIPKAERAHTLKAAAIMALLLVLGGVIAWSMWRRGKIFRGENGTAWEYQPAKASDTNHPAPAMKSSNRRHRDPAAKYRLAARPDLRQHAKPDESSR